MTEIPKKGDTIPRRPVPGSGFRSHFLVAVITTMFVVAALAPLIGFLAGVIVNLVTHWYRIGLGI